MKKVKMIKVGQLQKQVKEVAPSMSQRYTSTCTK
jgi:hypothetical protein